MVDRWNKSHIPCIWCSLMLVLSTPSRSHVTLYCYHSHDIYRTSLRSFGHTLLLRRLHLTLHKYESVCVRACKWLICTTIAEIFTLTAVFMSSDFIAIVVCTWKMSSVTENIATIISSKIYVKYRCVIVITNILISSLCYTDPNKIAHRLYIDFLKLFLNSCSIWHPKVPDLVCFLSTS